MVSWFVTWKTWEGSSDDKGEQWENGKGKPLVTHHANGRGGRSLGKMGEDIQRDQPWERGRCSRQKEAFKPGKTIQVSSHSLLFTFITPQRKRHKGIY